MSKGRARDLLLVGRKLAELPQLDGAFAAGRLSWSKVRRIARVATADTEAAWIARAEGVSHETVEALVAVAKEGEGPRELERGLPATRFVRRLVEDALQYELFEQARAKLEAELGRSVTDGELVQDAIRLFLGSSADGTVPGRRPVDASLFRVAVEEAGAAEAGDPAEEAARSDAVLPPRLRRRVLGRDGHRCKVCSSQRHLMIHHVVWRSRGGPTMLDNLVTLCARCHGLVHDGFLGVARRPEGVGFAFTDRKGRPLEGRHPSVAASIAVTACAAAHAAPTATNGVAPLRSEADIPAVVDSAWWRAHEYELEWTARGIRLRRASRRAG